MTTTTTEPQRQAEAAQERLDELKRLGRAIVERLKEIEPGTDKDGVVILLMAEQRLFERETEARDWLHRCQRAMRDEVTQ